jgi:hypothetical protein
MVHSFYLAILPDGPSEQATTAFAMMMPYLALFDFPESCPLF